MSDAEGPTADAETVEALRRVKAAESDWEVKLRAAREEADRATRRARDEAEALLKEVGSEVASERARRLEEGRAAAEREAETIREAGAKTADAVRLEKGRRPADRPDEVLEAVLGPYAHD